MAGNPSYRCEDCIGEPERCSTCREARRKVRRRRREEKRSQGVCSECHRLGEIDRATGKRRSRCRIHREENNRLSSASHKRATAAASASS